jgi:hypothetical protein
VVLRAVADRHLTLLETPAERPAENASTLLDDPASIKRSRGSPPLLARRFGVTRVIRGDFRANRDNG